VSTAATAGDLEAQLVYRRAVEATIWGMPAVSMAAVRRSLSRDLDAGYGDVIYFTRPMEPRHEFLTANNQTPYVVTFFDLKAGPMVLEVPAASDEVALFGSAIDSWQVPLADVGPTGEDAGKGGRYLFLPRPPGRATRRVHRGWVADPLCPHRAAPDHHRQRDAGGRRRLQPAAQGLPLGGRWRATGEPVHRCLSAGLEDPAQLRRALPGATGRDDRPRAAPGQGRSHDRDAGQHRHRARHAVPAPGRTGRAAGQGRAGRRGGHERLLHQPGLRGPLAGPALAGHQARERLRLLLLRRWQARLRPSGRGFSFWATWAPKRLGDPTKLPASSYLKCFADASGELFKGDRTFRLRVPADIPARDFWAIIAYEIGTNAFIHNPDNRVGVSSYDRDNLTINQDRSVDVYLRPQAPQGLENNWQARTSG
jgi:hypothetical protein